jgi:hypothetical protein
MVKVWSSHFIWIFSCTMDSTESQLGLDCSQEKVSLHFGANMFLLKVNYLPVGVLGFIFLMFSWKVMRCG